MILILKVSWIRRSKDDYHLLTVGLTTYSSDERFNAIHREDSDVSFIERIYLIPPYHPPPPGQTLKEFQKCSFPYNVHSISKFRHSLMGIFYLLISFVKLLSGEYTYRWNGIFTIELFDFVFPSAISWNWRVNCN